MSNETGLDWLARNVHVWREGKLEVLVCWPRNVDRLIWSSSLSDAGWITKNQWLARRAELQNKPSWKDWPQWDFMAQNKNGCWIVSNRELIAGEDGRWHGYGAVTSRGTGEVLGDWRDTLENRPADLSEEAVTSRLKEATDNVLSAVSELMTDKYKFEPFTSIEDNQEKKMKQDNGWFERGELPPVGVACEAYIDYPPQWVEAEIVAHKDGFAIGWCKSVMKGCHGDKASEFRPIRTERDVLLEVILSCGSMSEGVLADTILAAGFKRG